MQRNAIDDLVKWKNSSRRKPHILKGARQVGKTWLMKEFAKNNYDNFLYISFDKEEVARELFKTLFLLDVSIHRLESLKICENK